MKEINLKKLNYHWENNTCGTEHPTIKSNIHNKKYYDSLTHFRYFRLNEHDWAIKLVERLGVKNKTVLELGCGAGTDSEMIARHGGKITGVDLTEAAIKHCKKRFNVQNLDGKFIIANIEELPFPDNSFDRVYSLGVIHHCPNPHKVIKEVHRVLKNNGKFCIILYNKTSYLNFISFWLPVGVLRGKFLKHNNNWIISNYGSEGLTRMYSRAEVKRLFKCFKDIKQSVRGLQRNHVIPEYILTKIDFILPKSLFRFLGKYVGWYRVIEGKKVI